MEQYTYDTFISYRRDGGSEKAQLIKSELIQRGIQEDRIFLDTHSLHDGKFKEKIKNRNRYPTLKIGDSGDKQGMFRCCKRNRFLVHGD